MFYINILDGNWQRHLTFTSHFLKPFLLRQYQSDEEFNSWLDVNNCAAIIFSDKMSETFTDFMSWIFRLSNLPSREQHSRKCLAAPHLFLPVFMTLLCMQNLSLKVITYPTYINLQHWQVIKYTILTLLLDKVPLTLWHLPVAMHLKVLSKTIKLVHISYLLLQLLIEPTEFLSMEMMKETKFLSNFYLFCKLL